MRQTTRGLLRWLAIAAMVSGCGDSDEGTVAGEIDGDQSCVVCHLDQTLLRSLAVEPPAGNADAGEG